MPFLERLAIGFPLHTKLAGGSGHAFIDPPFHALEATNVGMGIFLLHQLPQLVSIFGDAVLDIHFAPLHILLLPANGIGQAEVIGELGLEFLQLFLV